MSMLARLAGALGIYVEPSEAKMTSIELAGMIRAGQRAGSGANVSWDSALQVSTVLACARVIADGIAQVPFKLYRAGATRIEATDHPVYDLIYRSPNGTQTSFEWRETMAMHVVLTGNAFVRKLRVGIARRLASLELLEPQRVRVMLQADGSLRYYYTPPFMAEIEIAAQDMWHLRGPSWNVWMGLDATKLAREAIGLAMATESAHADFHRNGARVSGFYSVEGPLTPKQFEDLDKWLQKYAQGGERAGKTALLDRGAKFQNTGMSGVDAEHIATRRLQVEEICRAFRVMPMMVGQNEKTTTYASVEQMLIAHVVHTLMPWYERFEHSADVNLLTSAERAAGLYTKFSAAALMRGAAADRAKYYSMALGAGGTRPWMTQDEVRGLEELDPYGGHAEELGTGAMDTAPVTGGSADPNSAN
jgi:HK97 family phage portal protein